jgi:hypothetical protein
MEINYDLKPEDFVQFGKEIAPSQITHKPQVTAYLIMYFLFIFGDIIYALFSGSLKNWDLSAFLMTIVLRTVITFAMVIICLGIIKLIVRRKAKDVSQEQANGLFCEHRIVLTENELIEITDVNTSRYAWKAIGEIKELQGFVLINVMLSSTYVIPVRAFRNQEHLTNFIEKANYFKQNAVNSFQPSHFIEYEKSLS